MLLIGDNQGHPDEGMKNISKQLYNALINVDNYSLKILPPSSVMARLWDIAHWEPDVIHYLHGPTYKSILLVAIINRLCRGSRSVISFTHPKLNYFGQRLLRLFPPNVSLVQSTHWHQVLDQHGLHSIFLSLSGVDLERFVPVPHSKKLALRTKLKLPLDKKIILHVGHINTNRNLERLIPLQKLRDVQVLILGSSSTPIHGDLQERLLTAGTILHTVYVSQIEEYYQTSDCYVFPTLDNLGAIELPLSILEAMATDLPIITTKFGGLTSFFEPSESFVYLDDDFSGADKAILAAFKSPPNKNREKVLSWSWDQKSKNLIAVYENLTAQ